MGCQQLPSKSPLTSDCRQTTLLVLAGWWPNTLHGKVLYRRNNYAMLKTTNLSWKPHRPQSLSCHCSQARFVTTTVDPVFFWKQCRTKVPIVRQPWSTHRMAEDHHLASRGSLILGALGRGAAPKARLRMAANSTEV